MSPQLESDASHWRAYPVRAFALRAAVFVFPIAVSVVLGIVVSRLLPTPDSTLGLVIWWTIVLVTSTVSVYAADRFARRLLPLATLLRLSMLFPDRAPSRLKVARRVSGSRAIAAELERAHHSGVTGNRQEAAETILALVGALGDYDSRTRGHSERTQLFVTMLADELRLKPEDRGRLMWAALVHDIGKLKVPHEVLNKPGKPTDDEWHILHSHPVQGAHICEPLREWLGEWWYAIEQHHERFDGTGYPRGLSGKQISYGARIVAVADSYEVMTAARPYKRPMSAEAARQELIRCAGSQFDPDVVRAFLNISLGDMSRWSGPIAWLASLVMVRPGPMLGQVFGTAAGASAATVSVVGLSLAPAIASDPPRSDVANHSTTAGAPSSGSTDPSSPQPPTSPSPTSSEPGTPTNTTPSTPDSSSPTGPEPTGSGPTGAGPTRPAPTGPSTSPTPGGLVLVDDTLTATEDESQRVDVLANDHAPDGDAIKVVSVIGAQHGSADVTPEGVIRYTPAPDFHGTESLTYSAHDDNGVADTAHVAVTVVPVNDPPKALDDDVTLSEDSGGVPLTLVGNDSDADGDSLRVASVSHASHGNVAALPGGGYTYTPDRNFHGHEGLNYTVADGHGGSATGTVDVTVNSVNDPPVAGPAAYATSTAVLLNVNAAHGVLAGASDVDGDHLTVVSDDSAAVTIRADGSISYLPVLPGVLTVRYVISDGSDRTTGTVRITVTLLPALLKTLYLLPPESTQAGDLDTSPPPGGISDWDDDGKPGLTIKGSNMRESEDNRDKFRIWNYVVPDGGLEVHGPITMKLWTSLKGKAHEDLDYAAWVYDCAPGGSCQRIASAVGVHVNNWSTTTTWESREITVGSAQETVPKDHILRVRLAFNGTDVWMPLDNAHPSRITLTT